MNGAGRNAKLKVLGEETRDFLVRSPLSPEIAYHVDVRFEF